MTIKPEHMTALVYFAVLIMSFTTSMAMWSFQLTRSHGVLQTTLSSPSITSRKCYTGESCNITSRKCHTERDRITSALFRVGETWGWDRYFRIYCHPFSISSFLPWFVYSSADTYLPTCLFIYWLLFTYLLIHSYIHSYTYLFILSFSTRYIYHSKMLFKVYII